MNLPQITDSTQKEIPSECSSTSPQQNKRTLPIDTDTKILSSTNPLEKTNGDEFGSSTPLKKKRTLPIEARENNLIPTAEPLLEDSKQSNSEAINSPNINKHAKPTTHISGQSFKDIIYKCYYEDFYKPYKKLNSRVIPDCCNPETCSKNHKDTQKKAITTSSNGTFFSILDNPLENWLYDLSNAAFLILRPEKFFSSDVLRILFDYILNGPEENLVWDVKHILSSHFELHPPCMESMRQFYLNLLSQAHIGESYFKTDLVKSGVLHHVINQLEESHELVKPISEEQEEDSQDNVMETEKQTMKGGQIEEITFEIMEQRWNNFEPLLDREYNEVVDAINDLEKSIPESDEELIKTNKTMPRLAIALELIIDILEADFMICVSKMKKYISLESTEWANPIIKHFMDKNLHHRIFLLYITTTDQALWTQLSRLIGVMAEFEHLYEPFPQQLWHYPSLNPQCERFITTFCNNFDKCEWSDEERLMRLKTLHPPWLRLKAVMHWVNSDLKLSVGSDLKALVDTLHMHIISPMKLEKDIHYKVNDIAVNNKSLEFIKKATKKNAYGETMLHRICKDKKSSKSQLFILLSSPAVDVNAKDNYGWTPLHEAVLTGSVFKTKTLLQYQPPIGRVPVDLGAQNCQGSTPLHEAVIANNLDICKLLVDYGGACLLRKTDCKGVTPLHLAKENPDIKRFFDRVILTQELLNLSPDSVLSMSEFVVQLLVLACDAFLDDHHTWKVYNEMRFNPTPKKLKQKNWIVVDQNTLLNFRKDQDEFRKLRKILNKLAENPKNSSLVRLWDSKFHSAIS